MSASKEVARCCHVQLIWALHSDVLVVLMSAQDVIHQTAGIPDK